MRALHCPVSLHLKPLKVGCLLKMVQVANIVANNASLVLISLSLNQIIRSGIPIVTAFVGIVIEKTVGSHAATCFLVILGTSD